jgi:hypothetical protein
VIFIYGHNNAGGQTASTARRLGHRTGRLAYSDNRRWGRSKVTTGHMGDLLRITGRQSRVKGRP